MIFSGFCGLKFYSAASRAERFGGSFKNFIGSEFKQSRNFRGFKFSVWSGGGALWSR